MPIRPDLRHHYGKAWRATVQLVRERASNRCECTGACGDTHGASHVCLCVVAGDTPGVAHAAPGCKRCAGTGAAPAVCHAPNGVRIVRERDNPAAWALEADVGTWLPVSPFGENKPIRVVLTVAHLNQVAGDDRLENLQLLCQRCHLGQGHASAPQWRRTPGHLAQGVSQPRQAWVCLRSPRRRWRGVEGNEDDQGYQGSAARGPRRNRHAGDE
jgi:hypothetical protein